MGTAEGGGEWWRAVQCDSSPLAVRCSLLWWWLSVKSAKPLLKQTVQPQGRHQHVSLRGKNIIVDWNLNLQMVVYFYGFNAAYSVHGICWSWLFLKVATLARFTKFVTLMVEMKSVWRGLVMMEFTDIRKQCSVDLFFSQQGFLCLFLRLQQTFVVHKETFLGKSRVNLVDGILSDVFLHTSLR